MASRLLRTARDASRAFRAAAAASSLAGGMASRSARAAAAYRRAAAAYRAAAMASRSVRAAVRAAPAFRLRSGVIAALKDCPTLGVASTKPREYFSSADYAHLPDDAKTPTDKDLESDEAVWALYERWCKAFNKERDRADLDLRFKLFRYNAEYVHHSNTYLPPDPEEAAIYLQKRQEAKLLLSKGKDVSDFDEWYLPAELGPFADGEEPFISESSKLLLKSLEERDPLSAVEDVAE